MQEVEQIKSMFVHGEEWDGFNTHSPVTCGIHTILGVRPDLVSWCINGVCSCMRWPTGEEVVESGKGYLKMDLSGRTGFVGHTLTLTRVTDRDQECGN